MLNIFSSGSSRKALPAKVSLVAFGKHPGWDDHIPDLGHMTQHLVNVKRELYVEGIGGNIDSGAWSQMADEERLEGFHHLFLWHTPDQLVVGRMWSSSDGKGRKRYPMIVCAQCAGLSLPWVLKELPPLLEQIEQSCAATDSADVVTGVIDKAQSDLNALVQAAGPGAEGYKPPPDLLAKLSDRPEMGPDAQGLMRVLYQIGREFSDQRVSSSMRAKHMRVPACGDRPSEALLRWTGFLLNQISTPVPMLLVLPLGQQWIDLIIGDQQVGSQVYGIRVLPSKLPLTTDIPYSLDEAFIAQAKQRIAASKGEPAVDHGEPGAAGAATKQPATPAPSPEAGQESDGKPKRSVISRLAFALVAAVVLAVAGVLFVNHSGMVDEKYQFDAAPFLKWCVDKFY